MGRRRIRQILKFFWVILLVIAVVLVYFVIPKKNEYLAGVPELGMNSTAHLICSCLFVMEQSEAYCLEYAKLKQVNPKVEIDMNNRQVRASVLGVFSGSSSHRSPVTGCQVD